MATFKLGAIITDIAGSIGGSSIRRTGQGHSIYNKQGKQSKSANALASKKVQIGNIFSSWRNLDMETKTLWNYNASTYAVKDKFGQPKYLTGRQLYTKLNTQLIPSGNNSDASTFDIYIENPIISISDFSSMTEALQINWGGAFTSQLIYVSIYRLRSNANPQPKKKFKRLYVAGVASSSGVDIWDEFINEFPTASSGQRFGFNIQFVNKSGIMSSVQAFAMDLE